MAANREILDAAFHLFVGMGIGVAARTCSPLPKARRKLRGALAFALDAAGPGPINASVVTRAAVVGAVAVRVKNAV